MNRTLTIIEDNDGPDTSPDANMDFIARCNAMYDAGTPQVISVIGQDWEIVEAWLDRGRLAVRVVGPVENEDELDT